MATSRAQLKSWFETDDIPTQAQFYALFESFLHLTEDKISIAMVEGLANALSGKASTNQLNSIASLVKGMPFKVANMTELYATTSKLSLLEQDVTIVTVLDSGDGTKKRYELIDIEAISGGVFLPEAWEVFSTGSGTTPPTSLIYEAGVYETGIYE